MTKDDSAARLLRLGDSGLTLADPADDVRGFDVLDQQGEALGRVQELLVDEQEGKVRMLRIEEGGVLGLGAVPSFLPVEAVSSVDDRAVHVNQSRQALVDAPRYDPEVVDESHFYDELYAYYGYIPFWGPGYTYPAYPVSRGPS